MFFVLALQLFWLCGPYIEPESIINISDSIFLNLLINAGIDSNGDGKISHNEARSTTTLNVSEDSISDLTGIEIFVNLDSLDCSQNQLTSINISKNTKLQYLNCGFNNLSDLDISQNIKLKELCCSGNELTTLNVNNNTELIKIQCNLNSINILDFSNNILLEEINCCFNRLVSLNVTKNYRLKYLDTGCFTNNLTTIDVSNNLLLETFACSANELTYLDISNNQLLKFLSIGANPFSYDSFLTVCVWEMPFPPDGLVVWGADPDVYYTMSCN